MAVGKKMGKKGAKKKAVGSFTRKSVKDVSSSQLEAAIAEAAANAVRERTRPVMVPLEKRNEKRKEKRKDEEGPSTSTTTRKRVSFAPLPEKHHALRMPMKRRKTTGGREAEPMRSAALGRGMSSLFSPLSMPPSVHSISSPDRSGRRAAIVEAMKARARELEQKQEEAAEWKEEEMPEIKLALSATPLMPRRRRPLLDEFESSDEEEEKEEGKENMEEERSSIEALLTPLKQPSTSRTPVKTSGPRAKTTVSPIDNGSAAKKKKNPSPRTKNGTPAKNSREAKAQARSAAAAARKKQQERVTRMRRLKRDLARRLVKTDARLEKASRVVVEEEDRYWRTTKEVRPLEQSEFVNEKRLLSWSEIHTARRKLSMDVETRKGKDGRRVESLHSVSTSPYLACMVQLKKRIEEEDCVKVVKSFKRARSPSLDWSYEEKETEEAAHPTVPALFVPGGEVRVL